MAIARNNAFGAGSPSWNLSFPEGNLTVSEILTYLPHWLKSVDVILRLVNHGARSVILTHLLKTYRIMPSKTFLPNSTTVMMHYAMRRAGKPNWTIGTRNRFKNDREYDEDSLYVGDFRPPRLTHPKSASNKQKVNKAKLARNSAADPIPFKDLALHVKEHPSGDEALDLACCVKYALENPDEEWLFPKDFVALVEHIGGPAPVTHSHLDRELFKRYNHLFSSHNPERGPSNWNREKKSKAKKRKVDDIESPTDSSDANGDSEGDSEDEGEGEGEGDTEADVEIEPKPKRRKASDPTSTNRTVACQVQDSAMADTPPSAADPALSQVDGSKDGAGKRRSGRRVKKAPVYTEKDEYDTDLEAVNADSTTPRTKRALNRMPPTPKDEESDFEAKDEADTEDDLLPSKDEVADDSDFGTPTAARGQRTASRKARQNIQEQSPAVLMEQFRAAAAAAKPLHETFMVHSQEMMAAARAFETRTPVFITPPILSANRLVIDPWTVYLYAQEGCRNEDELWASALSMYRFGGPRRHAPFRELYRLTEPMPWDTSDWAENVRWGKEQYKAFGVETWTEYDAHLEYITNWRRQSLWASEEAVCAGMQMM